ncbi:MAG TPA: nuclear transport factor 2 family protein [Steroidobacteraceae bacterium]|jgi:hypothetical protein
MSEASPASESAATWQHEIRAREQAARVAFLAADVHAMEQLLADGYIVNSPLQKVVEKRLLLELLRTGRIRHSAYECEIEHMSRHGDVVVVMGRDSVVDPPNDTPTRRRYTNVWQLQGDVWRAITRHAHVLPREVGT